MKKPTASQDTCASPHRLDARRAQDFLKALQDLSDAHGLGMDGSGTALARAGLPKAQDQEPEVCSWLQALFPLRTAAHAQELGESPQGAYPRLLATYAAASGGDFAPQGTEADSDDGWNTLVLVFGHAGKSQKIKVSAVEDSDWFAPEFVQALNRFAKRTGLPGRWVDFHGDDACTSIYVPEAAYTRFKALRKKFSTLPPDEASPTPEQKAYAQSQSITPPPPLQATLGKEQLAARKAEWPGYEARLRIRHSKSEVKMLERYFLSGKEPQWDMGWENDPIPLLYRLWLNPDQSDTAWCAVTERVLAYENSGRAGRSVRDSANLLQEAYQSAWDGVNWPAGAFGGAEKRLLNFLLGRTPCSAHFLIHGKPLLSPITRFAPAFCSQLHKWLTDTPLHNPCLLVRFQVGDWLSGINDEEAAKIVEEYSRHDEHWLQETVTAFFKTVASWPAPTAGEAGDERQAFCQEVRGHLGDRPLPAPFDAWWAQAQQNAAAR